MLRTFSYYLNTEQVKKGVSDKSEAKGLMQNALQDYDAIRNKFKITEETASILFKNIYDCIRSALQAFLSIHGETKFLLYKKESAIPSVRKDLISLCCTG